MFNPVSLLKTKD